MRARSKEERDANKGKRDKKKVVHDAFLEKQKGIYQKEMDALVRERKELENVKADYEIRKKETVAAVKGKVMQYFEDNKDKLGIDTTEKEDISKFITKPSVKAVFDKFDVPLKYFFEFYSRSEHHVISNELERNMESMNKKEFIRFAYQTHIVPALIPIKDMNNMFKLLVRERMTEDPQITMQVLDYKYFMKSLVRIAAIAQDYLGGQKGKLLEKHLQELEEEKQKTIKMKDKIAKKLKIKVKGKRTARGSDTSLDRGGETSGNNTGRDTEKSVDKSVDKSGDNTLDKLHKRGAKKPRKKVQILGFKEQSLRNSSNLKNVVSEADLLNRNSKNINLMLENGNKTQILMHMKNVKVEDIRIAKSVDVSIITAKTIETLLEYLDLLPEDNKYTLDKKLNTHVRRIEGAKPNKFTKTIVPKKAEAVDKDTSDDEPGYDSTGSPLTRKSKTEKTGNSDSEDKSDGETVK
jgi:hypothetical protein